MNSEPHNTSLTLIARAKDRQPAAWVRLVQLYGPLVYSWGRAADFSPAEVGTIVQDVFAQVQKQLDAYDIQRPPGGFRLWLWQITDKRLNDCRAHHQGDGSDENGRSAEPARPTAVAGADPRTLLISAAVRIIKAESESNTWDAFWRMAVHGETAIEIAVDLGTSPRAVRAARFQVTRKLRDLLADDLEELSLSELPVNSNENP
ncbi:MAG: sigma-70 family RNA polymerase sigma factor [Planctomycetaceae bacterium]|nr:sigma-70 family RNA polymerase sigma factor [Planctomycetaceae bacterium]